jgi:hypothetical protein
VVCAQSVLTAVLAEADFMALKLAAAALAAILICPPRLEAQSLVALMLVHSWYDDKCCHDKDCRPVPCEEIEKISDGWLGAIGRPNNATGFRTIA